MGGQDQLFPCQSVCFSKDKDKDAANKITINKGAVLQSKDINLGSSDIIFLTAETSQIQTHKKTIIHSFP